MDRVKKHAHSNLSIFLLTLFLVTIVVLMRIPNWQGIFGRMLWAEDGHVFITGAFEDGWAALASPYAGYLHLYPRGISLMATRLGEDFLAPIMAVGWFVAYFAASIVCVYRLRAANVALPVALTYPVFLGLMPTTSETLFTVTNAQWYLAIGLVACTLLPPKNFDRWPYLVFALIASLTGPFCIILLPLAILQAVLLKKIACRQFMLLIILFSSLIQLSFFVGSGRLSAPSSHELGAWLQGIYSFATFGSRYELAIGASCLFWLGLFTSVMVGARNKGWFSKQILIALTLIAAASLFMAAGFYAMRDQPQIASPLGFGARYFIIPYGVLLMALFVIGIYARLLMCLAVTSFFVVCVVDYKKFDRPDLGYERYLQFSHFRQKVFVPINPQFENFRGGFYLKRNSSYLIGSRPQSIEPSQVMSGNEVSGEFLIKSYTVPAKIVQCHGDKQFLGVELGLDSESPANITAYWEPTVDEGEQGRLTLAVYSGEKIAQFALRSAVDTDKNLIIIFKVKGSAELKTIDFYCVDAP